MSKVETASKVSLELTTRMSLGRRGARAKRSILDIVHKPLRSLERVKDTIIEYSIKYQQPTDFGFLKKFYCQLNYEKTLQFYLISNQVVTLNIFTLFSQCQV